MLYIPACSALALTIEELRALLAVVLGTSDLVLLFTLRALADEQLTADKVTLNLQVLKKQVGTLADLPVVLRLGIPGYTVICIIEFKVL